MQEIEVRNVVQEELIKGSDASAIPRIRHRIAVHVAERVAKPFVSPEYWERFLGLEKAVSRLYPVLCYIYSHSSEPLAIEVIEETLLLFEQWQKMPEFLMDVYEDAPERLKDVWSKDALMEQAAHAGVFREEFSRKIVEEGRAPITRHHLEVIKEMIGLTRLALFGEKRLAAFIKELDDAWDIARSYPPLAHTTMG